MDSKLAKLPADSRLEAVDKLESRQQDVWPCSVTVEATLLVLVIIHEKE